MSLANRTKVIRHSNAVAAGTTTITPGTAVDRANFEGVVFDVLWGAIVAGGVQSVKVQQSDSPSSGFADLAGSNVAVADDDDNKITRVEIFKPTKRYLKAIVLRATQNSTVDGIVATLHTPRVSGEEIVADATLSGQEVHVSPAEGTA